MAALYIRRGSGLRLVVAAIACAATAAMGAAKIDWAKAQLVDVAAVEYRFIPNHLVLRRGVAYRLHLANRGKELHELTAPAFFKTVELRNPEALNLERTELALQPGEHTDLYFVATRPGHYDMWCADHDWAGMTGDITVK